MATDWSSPMRCTLRAASRCASPGSLNQAVLALTGEGQASTNEIKSHNFFSFRGFHLQTPLPWKCIFAVVDTNGSVSEEIFFPKKTYASFDNGLAWLGTQSMGSKDDPPLATFQMAGASVSSKAAGF